MKNLTNLESSLFLGLSHPKRVELLRLIAHHPLCVSELVPMLGISQANVSQHLMLLRRLGLVTVESRGTQRCYSVAHPQVSSLLESSRSILLHRLGVDLESLNEEMLHEDPVCGMQITSHAAAKSVIVNHKRWYFCAVGCAKRFEKNPSAYIQKQQTKEAVL